MTGQSAPNGRTGRDRGDLIGQGGLWLAKWSLILVSVSAGAWVVGWLIAALWVVVLPVLLAIIVATVLWPPTRSIMRVGLPPAASAATALVVFSLIVVGVVTLIVPSVVDSTPELVDKASDGVSQVQNWLKGPPVNLQDE